VANRALRHADAITSDIVRSIAGVGPISFTGNTNPDYGEHFDLKIGFSFCHGALPLFG
jgi:hypothetical protein